MTSRPPDVLAVSAVQRDASVAKVGAGGGRSRRSRACIVQVLPVARPGSDLVALSSRLTFCA